MKSSIISFFKALFSIICFFGASVMVGYWMYKFGIDDRDIGMVDYILVDEADDIELPNLAMCLTYPALEKRLMVENQSVSKNNYYQYLVGDIEAQYLEKIDYRNVTIHMNDYFIKGQVKLFNRSTIELDTSNVKHTVVFNGFIGLFLVKCFVSTLMDIESRNIESLFLYYHKAKLMKDLNPEKNLTMHMNFIYPTQFLLQIKEMRYFNVAKYNTIRSTLINLEILKSRNSHNRRCLVNSNPYDEHVFGAHIQTMGCRAPYMPPFELFPICSEKEDIRNSRYGYHSLRKSFRTKSCQRISNFQDKVAYLKAKNPRRKKQLRFEIHYPSEVKVITQSKEVDGHTLIGNIGGYIGLFLGKL